MHYCSKVWGQWDLFKEINTFIQQGCIELIKRGSYVINNDIKNILKLIKIGSNYF